MTQHYPNYRNQRPFVELTLIGVLLAISAFRFAEAGRFGCIPFDTALGVASEVLRSVLLLAPWQCVLVHVLQHASLLHHALQLASSLVSLL